MILLDEQKAKLSDIQKMLKEAAESINVTGLKEELADYKKQMEAPDFWDDIDKANEINKKVKPIEDKLKSYEELAEMSDDAETLMEMAQEEDDESLLPEIDSSLDELNKKTESFRLAALLSGDQKTFELFRCQAPELVHLPEATYDWYSRNYLDQYYPVRFMMRLHGVTFPTWRG